MDIMETTTKRLERWWRVPLLLLVCLLVGSSPTRAGDISGTDFYWIYLMNNITYNQDDALIDFKVCFFNDYGDDEGFIQAQGGLNIFASKDNGKSWQKIINIYTDASHNLYSKDRYTGCNVSGTPFKWDSVGVSSTYKNSYHTHVNWKLPLQWRNCYIQFKCVGKWCDANGVDNVHTINNIDEKKSRYIYTPYTFTVRDLNWNGDFSISPDGKVTIPYKFGNTAGNTDGETAIWTEINGSWTGNIAKKEPGNNFNAGTYSFKLEDIGMNFFSNFTIRPYHEFKHLNDKDNNNAEKCYKKFAETRRFIPLPKATITEGVFEQVNRQVVLKWKASNTNYQTGNKGTRWAIYRNGKFLTTVLQDETNTTNYDATGKYYVFNDTEIPNDQTLKYQIYYLWTDWDEKAKADDLKSNEFSVNTIREVPINNLLATSLDDRIEFTWTSTGYPAGWGNLFKIYMMSGTTKTLLTTITPKDYQSSFKWVHKTSTNSTRTSYEQDGVYYTEEQLNNCTPHDYIIESYIDDTRISDVTVEKRAIGLGTQFYSLDATKGAYAGIVKLTWNVNLRGWTGKKTYEIHRHTAESNGNWTLLQKVESGDEIITFTDDTPLPGVYYEYRVTVIDECGDGTKTTNSITDIGFAQTTGTVSGRITYGSSGMAVAGVDVVAKKIGASATDNSQYHALHFTGTDGAAKWEYPSASYAKEKFEKADFSFQLWIKPDDFCDNVIVRLDNNVGLAIDSDKRLIFSDDSKKNVVGGAGPDYGSFGLYLKEGQYSHVTVTRQGRTLTCYLIEFDANGIPEMKKGTSTINQTTKMTITGNPFSGGGVEYEYGLKMDASTQLSLGYFNGYIDDFRLWTKCLTEEEILENYDHLLVGNESGLETYWTFDEGLSEQFFDYSREGTVYHEHHGKIGGNVESKAVTPSALALKAKTDGDGSYIIHGIPFSGEGTTYAIVPELNSHDFNPTQQLRFVSNNSLVHNSTDFTDVSSFPVSGKVFYAGTDYPVKGVNFYVDGIPCTRGGQLIATNDDGEYTISVPIGNHYITAALSGHVFANDGRYPPDPLKNDSCFTFIKAVNNLEFQDETLVNFTGRVVGGDIEGSKTLGFGLSENNIGVTELVLTPVNTQPRLNVVKVGETSVSYDTNENTVEIASATDKINSTSWRGAGSDDCRKLFINTDPVTGEFSAMVPPLLYSISSMRVLSNDMIDFGVLPTIDLTNPLQESKETLTKDDEATEDYTYNGILRQTYYNPEPTFNVVQDGRADGSFGISSYKFKDSNVNTTIENIYEAKSDGSVQYNYGVEGHKAPLFVQGATYRFNLEGYEEYKNYDRDANNPVVSKVPLSGAVVTINNALSDDQEVWTVTGEVTMDDGETYQAVEGSVVELKSNQLLLDENGKAVYNWSAGLPNVSSPYTRTISITYDINGRVYPWKEGNGKEGIILGNLPTGNNFVTSGPDKLSMILRDPPGSGSSAEWSTGTATSITRTKNDTWSDNSNIGITWGLGSKQDIQTGTVTGVPGAQTVTCKTTKIESVDDLTTTATLENEGEAGETVETSISISEAVATSGETDFVGADGDVFIGQATNLIFGNARRIGFLTDGTDFSLGLRDVISTSLSFGTIFSYTQSYIENTLLPNFVLMRNSRLKTATQAEINQYNPKNGVGTHKLGKKAGNLYLTTLSPDDDGFGEDGSYTVVIPEGMELKPDNITDPIETLAWALKANVATSDSVKWINNQMDCWKKYLALNEKEKVHAFELRDDKDSVEYVNYSFDGGASRTYTWEKDSTNTTTWEWTVASGVIIGNHYGFEIDGVGQSFDLEVTASGGRHESSESGEEYTTSFSYTLAEEGSDAITVDVYRYGAFSPIFRTRGGQTSNPYEGEVRTTYYEDKNGSHPVIMEATMQIEVPQIDVDVPVVSDIPTGSAANYTLRLGNASEIGKDVAYRLFVLDETNPDGAQLSIDGKVLTEGRLIKVPGNQTLTKTLQLRQTDTSILDYEGNNESEHELYKKGIGIVFASDSQPETIADTIFITAYFVPSSSDVALKLSNTTMNTQTGTDLTLTFSGFDRNYHNLKAFRLQYKPEGATDWTQIEEFVVDPNNVPENSQVLPNSGSSVSYLLPMSSFPDGNYVFRCVSAATYGLSEVYKYSDEIALIKDTKRPTPMGQPEPTDGVLDIGDELSVAFNETILKGELTKEANFVITGVLNGSEVAHETALSVGSGSVAATTEASINLANKDFSIDAWMNIGGACTMLTHGKGTNKLTIGTDSSNKLVVDIAGNSYTSTNSVPTGKWAFLAMNLTADGKLSATVASADETVVLFNNKEVATYAGNGPLSVGASSTNATTATSAIHELLLWDEAHDLATALANRSKSKSPSTRHLIGYWKMDEGEGKEIRDYSRSRNMTMPDETWYINNENKSVAIDGSHYVSINATMLPITEFDDYAVEFWMRGDVQADTAQLVQMGDVALWLDKEGKLMLTGKKANSWTTDANPGLIVSNASILDKAWHHIALNVLRQGAAAVYVDGQRCLTTNAANVGAINTDKLVMGARRFYKPELGGVDPYLYNHAFKGEFDEMRVWGATINGDQLTKNRKVRLTGSEPGLVAYYPFETKGRDDYNQIITKGTAEDLTGSGLSAQLVALGGSPAEIAFTNEAPALRAKPIETNVSFTYTASDEKIVINIDEEATTIEGCTLNFTVRDVRDVNGNFSVPAIWSAFVNRNELVWADDALNVEQHVETTSSVTATIVNKGGKQQMWTLDGMPAWLQASSEYGTTNPRSETTVTFTVSPATPIGKYEETIYLKGNDGIETPLTINVKVTGDEPLWTINPADYEESMNIIGSLFVLDQMSEDEDDLIGAFINDECRGVAHPVYNKRYDSYFVTMNIYGSSKDIDDNEDPLPIEFKAYDASTGIIYPVVRPSYTKDNKPAETVFFIANDLIGRYAVPAILTATDEVEQNIDLAQGWNWMSLGVKPGTQPEDFTVEKVYEKAYGRVDFVKNNGQAAEYDGDDWIIYDLTRMNNREMYAVQTNEAFTLNVTGHRVDSSQEPISVAEGWSWVAFNGLSVMSLDEALADMEPQDDEIIKGQHGVAYYDSYEWLGNLTQLTPGQGYKIQGKEARTFTYPVKTATSAGARSINSFTSSTPQLPNSSSPQLPTSSAFTPVDYHNYPGNMVLVAQLVLDGQPVEGVELGICASVESEESVVDYECREAAVSDRRGLVITTIPGDKPCELSFRVSDGSSDEAYVPSVTITYENDAVVGTPKAPFIIDLGEATGIVQFVATDSQQAGQVFDMQGRKVELNDQGRKLRKGVYIVNGQKKVK